MRRVVAILIIGIVMGITNAALGVEITITSPSDEEKTVDINHTYSPNGKTEYVIPYSLAKYASSNDDISGFFSPYCAFYSTIEAARKGKEREKFLESDYSLKRFYVMEHDPSFMQSEELYALIFENGQIIYMTYYNNTEQESTLPSISSIRLYDDYISFQTAVSSKQEVYPNSGIRILEGEFYTVYFFTLDNGVTTTSEIINSMAKLMNYIQLEDPITIAVFADEILTEKLNVRVDNFDNVAYIYDDNDFVPFDFYLVFTDAQCYPRAVVRYRDSSWLFFNAITLGTDNIQWSMDNITPERQTLDGSAFDKAFVQEKADFIADEDLLEMMRRFTEKDSIKLRIRGDGKYVDKNFTNVWLEQQQSLIHIFDAYTQK